MTINYAALIQYQVKIDGEASETDCEQHAGH